MKAIERIREKFFNEEYEFTLPHFFDEMMEDDLEIEDIGRIIKTGRIRRKFTRDPRGTRYEIPGHSCDEREVAIICRIKSTGKLLLITIYVL